MTARMKAPDCDRIAFDLQRSAYTKSATDKVWLPDGPDRPFDYSDGDEVEKRIFDVIARSPDRSVFSPDLAAAILDWPSLYHLSSRRANLLRPVIDLIEGDVLEIGAGCGAITRFLGEQQRTIIAMEGSRQRAAIAAQRCLDLPNVHVLADNFGRLRLDKKFDAILAIGVLEYAGKYFPAANGEDPCDAFLAHAASFLKAGGKLVIAIENQLGLKYFAGFREDHVGEAFFGIEDRYQADGVATFGRAELRARLAGAGLASQQWLYPFPDYKLPISVISDEGLRDARFDAGALCARSAISDPQRPDFSLFSLERAWRLAARNDLVADLANSFLVVASRERIEAGKNIAFHFGEARRKEFAKVVRFEATQEGVKAIRTPIAAGPKTISRAGVTLHLENEDYFAGELWHDRLIQIVNGPCWRLADVVAWTKVWWDALLAFSGVAEGAQINAFSQISGRHIDSTPRNMIVADGRCVFFDQEWEAPTGIELGFLLFRGLFDALSTMTACGEPQAGVSHVKDQLIIDIAYGLGFWLSRDDIRRYKDMESQFQERASGSARHFEPQEFGAALLPIRMRLEALTAAQARLSISEARTTQLEAALDAAGGAADRLAASEARLAELEATAAASAQREQALGEALAARTGELESARADHAAVAAHSAAGEARLAALAAELEAVTAAGRQRERALNAALAARRDELERARADHSGAVARLALSEARLAALAAEWEARTVAHRQREQALGEALAGRTGELAAARADCAEALERSAAGEASLAALAARLEAEGAAARQREEALDEALAARSGEVEAARTAALDAERREQALRTANEAAGQSFHAQLRALRGQLVDAEAAVAKCRTSHASGDGWRAILPLNRARRAERRLTRSGLFDADWYAGAYDDVAGGGRSPASHFLEHGYLRGYRPNPFFDTRWYLERYEDVRRSGMNPVIHYLMHGFREGRDPGPDFHTDFYLETNPDVRASEVNPLAHYLRHGRHEGRLPARPA